MTLNPIAPMTEIAPREMPADATPPLQTVSKTDRPRHPDPADHRTDPCRLVGLRLPVRLYRRWALVHFQTEGEMAQTPSCYAVTGWRRTESGRPATNIRLSTATPMAASVCCAAKPRARSRGPISVL
jgi:hypothetical protein